MKRSTKLLASALGIILLGSIMSTGRKGAMWRGRQRSAHRGPELYQVQSCAWQASPPQIPRWPGGDERDEYGFEPIVGLWKQVLSDPAQNYGDKGYTTWHSDHTEFLNSERTPSTGAVCQGVWAKVGHSQYRLNHFALAFGDDVHLTNVIQIRELVTVDPSRNVYRGRFTVTIYDTQHTQLAQYKGEVPPANAFA